MRELTLYRGYQDGFVTLGMLRGLPQPIYTLEEPWMHNKRGISCVPLGRYLCTRHDGTRFQNVWKLNDVPERSAILIHNGNTVDHVEGCILVGFRHGVLKGKRAVLESTLALNYMRDTIGRNPFYLTIKE